MKLGFKFLDQVADVNHYRAVEKREIVRGNADSLFFRLETIIDNNLHRDGLDHEVRYIPVAGATLVVTFANLDSSETIVRVANNPFPGDTSIFMVPILPTDVIQFNSCKMLLTEGAPPTQVQTNILALSELTSVDTDFRKFLT